jgi:hypothetical protein
MRSVRRITWTSPRPRTLVFVTAPPARQASAIEFTILQVCAVLDSIPVKRTFTCTERQPPPAALDRHDNTRSLISFRGFWGDMRYLCESSSASRVYFRCRFMGGRSRWCSGPLSVASEVTAHGSRIRKNSGDRGRLAPEFLRIRLQSAGPPNSSEFGYSPLGFESDD